MPPSSRILAGFRQPVVILAGGADGEGVSSNAAASRLFVAAFSGFSGTLVSGGTTSGIAGIAGEVVAAHPRIVAIGYLPQRLPPGASRDRRYAKFRTTPAKTFGAADCLHYWTDLLTAGVPPPEVKLIGWGGGRIAAIEYRIALVLGARVGIIAGTGRAADEIRNDPAWAGATNLFFLPADTTKVHAFLARS
jgi:hypothetical protein